MNSIFRIPGRFLYNLLKDRRKRYIPLWVKISLSAIAVYSVLAFVISFIISARAIHSLGENIEQSYSLITKNLAFDIEKTLTQAEETVSSRADMSTFHMVFDANDYTLLEGSMKAMPGTCDAFFMDDFKNNRRVITTRTSVENPDGTRSTAVITSSLNMNAPVAVSDYLPLDELQLSECADRARQGRSHVTQPYFKEISFEPVYIIAYPIHDGGKPVGMIAMRYRLTSLWDKVDAASADEGVTAYLIDKSGVAIAHTDRSKIGNKLRNAFVRKALSFEAGIEESDLGRQELIGAYYPIKLRIRLALVIEKATHSLFSEIITTIALSCAIFVVSIIVIVLLSVWIGKYFTRPVEPILKGIEGLKKSIDTEKIPVISGDEFGIISTQFNQMLDELKEKERIKSIFGNYISSDIRDEILEHDITFEGTEHNCTILFTDIRGFTSITEKFDAKTVLHLLNTYFSEMIKIVNAHKGIVNKFIGDALMVLYGIPIARGNHSLAAVLTAREMLARLEVMNATFYKEYGIEFRIGAGIATGVAIAGNIGGHERMEYSVIGDIVNIASRLESLTKEFKTPIIINEETKLQIENEIRVKGLGSVAVRGKAQELELYCVDMLCTEEYVRGSNS